MIMDSKKVEENIILCSKMETFKELYKQLCQKYQIGQQDFIPSHLESSENGKLSLNLSACNLSESACFVLGKVLKKDSTITDLHLCNCMLSYKGVKSILDGLCSNSSIRFLSLKGNGLGGTGAKDIGKLLTYNKTLNWLSVEWNSLGKLHDEFTLLCSGLSVNKSLKALDLRSNQINNDDAIALASALSKNSGLNYLDLRWNQITHLGARSLLNVLKQYNKSLLNLDLAGNLELSNAVLQEIASALRNNCNLQLLQDQLTRKKEIADYLQSITVQESKEQDISLSSILQKNFQENEDILKNMKILENQLHEKKFAFDSMIERVNKLQNDLKESEEKNDEINKLLEALKNENSELKKQHQELLCKSNKDKLDAIASTMSEMDSVKEKKRHVEFQLECASKTQEIQQGKIEKLKETIESLEIQIKSLEIGHDEHIEEIKQQQKETIKKIEQSKQEEIIKVKKEIEEIENSLNTNINKLETERSQLKQEIVQLNGKLVEEKNKTEELLHHERLKFHKEMDEQHLQLSEKIHSLQTENDKQAKIISQQNFEIAQLKSFKEFIQIEKGNDQKMIDQLKEQILSKDAELRIIITNLEEENRSMHKELMKEKENQKDMQNKRIQLENENINLNNIQKELSENIVHKDEQIHVLKVKLQQKEAELQKIQQNEIQRTAALYSAFKNFMINAPHPDINSYFTLHEGNFSFPNT